jgi:hypothetical protein
VSSGVATVLPTFPPEGSDEELAAYAELSAQLPPLFREQFSDRLRPRSVVVVPSLSFDAHELAKITGVHHYEERMLCMLMLLRLPRTHVVYLTSQRIEPGIIDYHLHLLSGIPSGHARRRLHMFSCNDSSAVPLTRKLLDRPRLLERIKAAIPDVRGAHMTCFNVTPLERSLAVRLDVPLYGTDPKLLPHGTKSGSRELFREAGVLLPDGFEWLRDEQDVAASLAELKRRDRGLERAVVKLNEGFSGKGNSVFDYDGCPDDNALDGWVRRELPTRLKLEEQTEIYERYMGKLAEMGGVVEAFVAGDVKRSPSVQCRVNPVGEPTVISTHDQLLGGRSRQIFLGCHFPADRDYRQQIQDLGQRVAEVAATHGVIGRFGADFISVPSDNGWKHYGIEINLRKGGTTHPLMMMHFLTDGDYDRESGLFLTPQGQPRFYFASDNIWNDRYRGLLPEDLIDIVVCNELHYHEALQMGVAFHLIGSLSEFGKLGIVAIGDSRERAEELFRDTMRVINREVGAASDSIMPGETDKVDACLHRERSLPAASSPSRPISATRDPSWPP